MFASVLVVLSAVVTLEHGRTGHTRVTRWALALIGGSCLLLALRMGGWPNVRWSIIFFDASTVVAIGAASLVVAGLYDKLYPLLLAFIRTIEETKGPVSRRAAPKRP